MPYFDIILDALDARNTPMTEAFGRNVHWGYWTDPRATVDSPGEFRAAADAMSRELFAEARVKDGERVLDAGCGLGGTVALLDESFRELDVTGLNIEPRQLRRAELEVRPRPGSGNRLRFVLGDACHMPFPDGSFDVVLAVECTLHFSSRARFLAEAFRVLAPGGRLVLCDFVAFGPTRPLLDALLRRRRADVSRIYGDVRRPRTVRWFRTVATRAGFRDFRARDVTRNTLPTYRALRRLAPEFGASGERFRAVNGFLGGIARFGLYRYYILSCAKALGAR